LSGINDLEVGNVEDSVISGGDNSLDEIDADNAVYLGDENDLFFSGGGIEKEELASPIDSSVVVGPAAPDFALVSAEPIRVTENDFVSSGPLYRYFDDDLYTYLDI